MPINSYISSIKFSGKNISLNIFENIFKNLRNFLRNFSVKSSKSNFFDFSEKVKDFFRSKEFLIVLKFSEFPCQLF